MESWQKNLNELLTPVFTVENMGYIPILVVMPLLGRVSVEQSQIAVMSDKVLRLLQAN